MEVGGSMATKVQTLHTFCTSYGRAVQQLRQHYGLGPWIMKSDLMSNDPSSRV